MRSFRTALILCSLSWITVSGSELQTVDVQPGQEVTLLCSNISKHPTHADWFRLAYGTKPLCISSMYGSGGEAESCDGFQNEKFEMSSNVSTVFLKIKQVDVSDSGLYFCGFYIDRHTVIATATHLNVYDGVELDDKPMTEKDGIRKCNLMTVTLGGLVVFFMMAVIVLAVKNRKLQTAAEEKVYPERNKNLHSAAVKFLPKTVRNRRPASERQEETCVIYTATKSENNWN
ncbi:uncharacterized protein LOC109140677 [Larimichthys crocea]|uniref:uncharacterized protein LOC109140677 n=1 Tax=Larimichthys crocea TaxID=215358 RepID=UPI000900C7BB|nr:uncharacterized protein LOC109140677 [Larimichthys crocea]